jgi:hypothetical protein
MERVKEDGTMKKFGLLIALIFATATQAAAASPGYTIAGLKIQPPIGVFGAVRIGSCDLVTLSGCDLRTFTVGNVGNRTIPIGGFGIADIDPLTAALAPGASGSGCEFLPVVDGYWALSPGASCRIRVAFSPTREGLMRNELRIWYLDQSKPIAVSPLFGVGT